MIIRHTRQQSLVQRTMYGAAWLVQQWSGATVVGAVVIGAAEVGVPSGVLYGAVLV